VVVSQAICARCYCSERAHASTATRRHSAGGPNARNATGAPRPAVATVAAPILTWPGQVLIQSVLLWRLPHRPCTSSRELPALDHPRAGPRNLCRVTRARQRGRSSVLYGDRVGVLGSLDLRRMRKRPCEPREPLRAAPGSQRLSPGRRLKPTFALADSRYGIRSAARYTTSRPRRGCLRVIGYRRCCGSPARPNGSESTDSAPPPTSSRMSRATRAGTCSHSPAGYHKSQQKFALRARARGRWIDQPPRALDARIFVTVGRWCPVARRRCPGAQTSLRPASTCRISRLSPLFEPVAVRRIVSVSNLTPGRRRIHGAGGAVPIQPTTRALARFRVPTSAAALREVRLRGAASCGRIPRRKTRRCATDLPGIMSSTRADRSRLRRTRLPALPAGPTWPRLHQPF